MSGEPQAKAKRSTKRSVLLLGLIGAVLALATSTRTWIRVQPEVGTVKIPLIEVAGSDAAAAVAALAVVALAGTLAAMIAGRISRYIIAGIMLLAGGGIAGSAISVISDPVFAAATKVGDATGLNNAGGEYDLGIWPYLAVLGGLVLVAASLQLGVTAGSWAGSRKYSREAPASAAGTAEAEPKGKIDEIDGWDSLSRGDDPTG